MAANMFDKLGLNPRERRLVTLLGALLGVLLLVAGPVAMMYFVYTRTAEVEELRTALDAVQGARAQVSEQRAKRDAIAARYARRAPTLPGFIEQTASEQKLQVTDSVDRPEVAHGKRYVERHTVIHFKKAGMLSIARFLEGIERSGHPVAVSRLNIRKRSGEPDSYDVEVGVSAFDRNEKPAGEKDKPAEERP
jgi:general secretion pathway protein M